MLLSIFMTINKRNATSEQITTTLKSLDALKSNEFELIVTYDGLNINPEVINLIDQFKSKNKDQVKLLYNDRSLGAAHSQNVALKLAQGEYFIVSAPADQFAPNFITTLKTIVKTKAPDIIDVKVKYDQNVKLETNLLLPANTLLNLEEHHEVYALIYPAFYNKIFRLAVVNEFNLYFVRFERFDLLFVYRFLAHAKTYYLTDQTTLTIHLDPNYPYVLYRMISPWIHIDNYYRKQELLKKLKAELEFAYGRYLYYVFPQLISLTNNQKLIQKAIKLARKRGRIRLKNLNTNPYLGYKVGDLFPNLFKTLDQYFTNLMLPFSLNPKTKKVKKQAKAKKQTKTTASASTNDHKTKPPSSNK